MSPKKKSKRYSLLGYIVRPVIYLNFKLQKIRKVENCFIRFSGGWDGAGAQIHSIISIMLFSRIFGIKYLHNPLKNIEHYQGDRDEWSSLWEKNFSLDKIEPVYNKDENNLKSKNLKQPLLLWKRKNTVYNIHNCHFFLDLFPDNYKVFSNDFRKSYFLRNSDKHFKFNSYKKITIGLHIRRGDVNSMNHPDRYTTDEFLIKKLSVIVSVLKKNNIDFQISIFSEGKRNDFGVFNKFNPVLCINEDALDTMHLMINQDILIMAKSSFSYIAAIISEGIIFYEPFWHSSLKDWINLYAKDDKLKVAFTSQLKMRIN